MKLNLIKSKKGMTLTEVITGLAIFSLVALLVLIVLPTAIDSIGLNADIKRDIKGAASEIESGLSGSSPGVGEKNGAAGKDEFTVNFGDVDVSQKGNYIVTEDDKNARLRYFQPD